MELVNVYIAFSFLFCIGAEIRSYIIKAKFNWEDHKFLVALVEQNF